jgi:hypothetical protein|nr:MAG TPA: hypothetical protein [Bacteriophage sp.]
MIYNAHTLMKDFWSYNDLYWMPLRDCIEQVEEFMPRMKEIARQQEAERLKSEFTGQKNGMRPMNNSRRGS